MFPACAIEIDKIDHKMCLHKIRPAIRRL